jgi:transposase
METLPEATAECHDRIRRLEAERDAYKAERDQFKELIVRLWAMIQSLIGRFVHDSEQRERVRGELMEQFPEVTEKASERELAASGEAAGRGAGSAPPKKKGCRRRGQQPGSKGHGRRDYSDLPRVEVPAPSVDNPPCCEQCGKPRRRLSKEDTSIQVLWESLVSCVRYHRWRWALSCGCQGVAPIITDPVPAKPIPKSLYATPTLINLFLHRFEAGLPLNRVLKLLESSCGVGLAAGTAVNNFYHLYLLLQPLGERIRRYNGLYEKELRADETGWLTFFLADMRAWIWIFVGRRTTAFHIQPSRAAEVIAEHLDESLEGLVDGTEKVLRKLVLGADSFSAYERLCRLLPWVTHAQCWAHARRPLVNIVNSPLAGCLPRLAEAAEQWLDLIAEVYVLHERWLATEAGSQIEDRCHRTLMGKVRKMERLRQEQLADPKLPAVLVSALKSLERRWPGLMVPLRPENKGLSLDNNAAERGLRHPVVARKSSYGSQAAWAAELSALAWTLLATLKQNRLNLRKYLTSYLEACAANGGRPPQDLSRWLPWEAGLDPEQQRRLEEATDRALEHAARREVKQPSPKKNVKPACSRPRRRPLVQLSQRHQGVLVKALDSS